MGKGGGGGGGEVKGVNTVRRRIVPQEMYDATVWDLMPATPQPNALYVR